MKMKKNEKHHLERRIVQMEIIPNLCDSREVAHKDHARRA
jgi:hypothetical protein